MIVYKTIKKPDNTRTGQIARRRRETFGKSLRKTARAMGISAAYLSDLELGHRQWSEELSKKFNEVITQ